MGMLFLSEQEFMTFNEFLLCESIRSTHTDFGTNDTFDNNEWMKMTAKSGNILVYTFLRIDNIYYMVGITKKGNLMFSSADSIDLDQLDDISYLTNHFLEQRRRTKNILQVFGKLIYTVSQGLIQPELDGTMYIKFKGADAGLGKAYDVMVKNKYLLQDIHSMGYNYSGQSDNGDHIFTKL